MLPRKHPDGIHIAFDDHRLVNNAGLILPATLALHLGLPQLVDRRLDLGRAPGRANTGDKMMTLVASALAGGDCIDDADALRTGGMACTLGGTLKAPSTIDLDSTICETYGLAKEGARHHGYAGKRGYHPLLAVAAGTGDVLMSRLREGRANTARGAAHFLRETVGRVRYAGAQGQLTVRADSGFYAHAIVAVCREMDVRFSITIRQHKSLRNIIEAISEDAWTPITYWMDGAADVAETTYAASARRASMYMKKTVRRAPSDVKALMRIANGLELELRALKREIEARRDAQMESHERLGNLLDTGTLFHHDDRAERTTDGEQDTSRNTGRDEHAE